MADHLFKAVLRLKHLNDCCHGLIAVQFCLHLSGSLTALDKCLLRHQFFHFNGKHLF